MADSIEDTIAFAREIVQTLRDRRANGEVIEGIAGDFAETVVKLADACVIGVPCERHFGSIHGQEAELLRSGVELILQNTARASDDDAPSVLASLRKSLIFLLDRIDARDSLAFLEATDDDDDEETNDESKDEV